MPGRARIAQLLPHAGAMCLLEAVTAWDESRIHCGGVPAGRDHPLARDGLVPAIVAAEYAAQATALHGALLEDASGPQAGVLAKLTKVDLHGACFPAGAVTIRAEVLGRAVEGCMYSFEVDGEAGRIASGRLMVAFPAVSAA